MLYLFGFFFLIWFVACFFALSIWGFLITKYFQQCFKKNHKLKDSWGYVYSKQDFYVFLNYMFG